MNDKTNINVNIELPETWVAEFETRGATMQLEADEYCHAILALSLLPQNPLP